MIWRWPGKFKAGHVVKDSRVQQEDLDPFGLLFEDLFDQVVQHIPVIAGEGMDEPGSVFPSLH